MASRLTILLRILVIVVVAFTFPILCGTLNPIMVPGGPMQGPYDDVIRLGLEIFVFLLLLPQRAAHFAWKSKENEPQLESSPAFLEAWVWFMAFLFSLIIQAVIWRLDFPLHLTVLIFLFLFAWPLMGFGLRVAITEAWWAGRISLLVVTGGSLLVIILLYIPALATEAPEILFGEMLVVAPF